MQAFPSHFDRKNTSSLVEAQGEGVTDANSLEADNVAYICMITKFCALHIELESIQLKAQCS
jgi:hypothetical protein